MPVSDGRGLKAHVTTRQPRPEDPLPLLHAVPPSVRARVFAADEGRRNGGGGTEQAGVAPAAFRAGKEGGPRFSPSPSVANGRARGDRRLPDTCSRPARAAAAAWRRPGSRCSEKRSGRTTTGRRAGGGRMAIDGETDNVSRHRDTGCDGLKTFFPSPLSCLPRPSEAETFPA